MVSQLILTCVIFFPFSFSECVQCAGWMWRRRQLSSDKTGHYLNIIKLPCLDLFHPFLHFYVQFENKTHSVFCLNQLGLFSREGHIIKLWRINCPLCWFLSILRESFIWTFCFKKKYFLTKSRLSRPILRAKTFYKVFLFHYFSNI